MTLVSMICLDETALICDFAETYHIFDYRALPLRTAAALASGLRRNSRIMIRMSGIGVDPDTLLLAAAVDRLSFLAWVKTKDGQKNRNRPKSIVADLMGKNRKKDEYDAYESAEDFDAARARFLTTGGGS